MGSLLSRRRYEVLALAIALASASIHVWSFRTPVVGLTEQKVPTPIRAVQLLEGRVTDLKFRLRGERAPHPDVVVVAIDEKSSQKYGLWPWPRSIVARAVTRLDEAGARAIGFDVAFVDESSTSTDAAYREMLDAFDSAAEKAREAATRFASFRELLLSKRQEAPDEALERAFAAARDKVVQAVIVYPERDAELFAPHKRAEHERLLEPHVITRIEGHVPGTFFEIPLDRLNGWTQRSAQTPLQRFARTGTRLGYFNTVLDPDGTLRRLPMLAKLSAPKGFLPSLSLQTAAIQLGARIVPPAREHEWLDGVKLVSARGELRVPYVNGEPFTLIHHVGSHKAFPTLSIADVVEGRFDPAAVRGKAVLIGLTVTGLVADEVVTPFRENEPGVYSHASMLSNLLSGDFLTRPAWLVLVELLAMMSLSMLLARLLPRTRSFGLKLALIAAVAFVCMAADYALFCAGVLMNMVVPLSSVLATSFGLVFLGYLSTDREKLKLRETFSKYLGEDVMEEALAHPEKLARGEKREMTVLFSDIRGFTTLSERMLPEKLAEFIKEYLNPMTRIVFDEKGTLDKYIGDAVMAFWNAPLDQPDHALRACRAAVRFLAQLDELKKKWRERNYPEFDIGVGINTGPMVVGNMGSDVRVDYTVMGDAVNLASRLEGTNKEYDTRIIMSFATYEKVKGQVIARHLGAVRVKGKRKPIDIYELRGIGQPDAKDEKAIARFEEGVRCYVEQRFDDAARCFREVLETWPADPPSRRYLDEISVLKLRPPPPGWDGVYTATTK